MPLASTWSLEVPAGHATEAGAGREGHTTSAQARRTAGSRHKGACPQGAAATQPGFHGLWAVRDQSRSSPFARQAGHLELHVKFPNSRRLAQSVMRCGSTAVHTHFSTSASYPALLWRKEYKTYGVFASFNRYTDIYGCNAIPNAPSNFPYLFKLWFSLDIYPGVGLQDHMIAVFLVF